MTRIQKWNHINTQILDRYILIGSGLPCISVHLSRVPSRASFGNQRFFHHQLPTSKKNPMTQTKQMSNLTCTKSCCHSHQKGDIMQYHSTKSFQGAEDSTLEMYKARHVESIRNPVNFWMEEGLRFHWQLPFKRNRRKITLDFSNEPSIQWYKGGRTNIAYNCLERHIANGKGDQIAIRWIDWDFESNSLNREATPSGSTLDLTDTTLTNLTDATGTLKQRASQKHVTKGTKGTNSTNEAKVIGTERYGQFTYLELRNEVHKIVNVLRSLGVRKGDAITIVLPNTSFQLVVTLASLHIGAALDIVSLDTTSQNLAERILRSHSHFVVTTDFTMYLGRFVKLKRRVDEAIAICQELEGWEVKHSLIYNRMKETKMSKIDICLDSLLGRASNHASMEWMNASDPIALSFSRKKDELYCLSHSIGDTMVAIGSSLKSIYEYSTGLIQENSKHSFSDSSFLNLGDCSLYSIIGPLLHGQTIYTVENTHTRKIFNLFEKYNLKYAFISPQVLPYLMINMDRKESFRSLISVQCVDQGDLEDKRTEDFFNLFQKSKTGIVTFIPESITPIFSTINSSKQIHYQVPCIGVKPLIFHNGREITSMKDSEGSLCFQYPWPGLALNAWHSPQKIFRANFFTVDPITFETGSRAKKMIYKSNVNQHEVSIIKWVVK